MSTKAARRSWGAAPLVLAGAVEAVALALLAWWPGLGLPLPGLAFFGLAFGAYVAASLRGAEAPNTLWIWAFALLFRLVLLPADPALSDDVYRYLWDGHVQLQGVNPYRYAPADPALDELRTAWHDRINNPDVPTIYPPVAQGAFLLIGLLGGWIVHAKILWVALDLCTGWILGRVAQATGRSRARVLILYLWSPLLVVEVAWSGHLEPLGLLALSSLVLLGWRERPTRAGVAAAFATLTKFAPVAALPPLTRRLGPRLVVGFTLTAAAFYAPYLSAGSDLWQGLATYVRDWRFMVGPFALLEWTLPGRWPPRLAAGAVVAGIVGWTTVRGFSHERALFWILGSGLLLSPTVHPWYVLWILPFAALRSSAPWILLSGLVFLGYAGLAPFLETGVWPQPGWLRLLVWTPPLVWLAVDRVRARGGRGDGAFRASDPEREISPAE